MERPKRNDPAIIKAAAEKLAVDCAEWCGQSSPDEWLDDLVSAMRWGSGNGYEMAKELETRAHVSPDAELVELLDSASSYIWSAHNEAVKAWVAQTGFDPAFAEGQRVATPRGSGPIWRVDHETAQYVVAIDGENYGGGGGAVINAEQVTAEQVPA